MLQREKPRLREVEWLAEWQLLLDSTWIWTWSCQSLFPTTVLYCSPPGTLFLFSHENFKAICSANPAGTPWSQLRRKQTLNNFSHSGTHFLNSVSPTSPIHPQPTLAVLPQLLLGYLSFLRILWCNVSLCALFLHNHPLSSVCVLNSSDRPIRMDHSLRDTHPSLISLSVQYFT